MILPKTDDFLDDSEKLAVQMFVDNPLQREAVKKVLLWELYQNGTLKKGEPPNPLRNTFQSIAIGATGLVDAEQIGQRVMAMAEGINFLEGGFKELQKYAKKPDPKEKTDNPAR